ncbi:MAG: hypothetical protein KF739_04685 [Cryobacterium sp.]|nr:hypothetical protein [Cryobacterium sp.]
MTIYASRTRYTREDFLSDPGAIPMVRVNDGSMIVAVVTPEEFEEQYIEVEEPAP